MIGPTKLCPEGIGLVLLDLDDTVVADGTKISLRVVDAINLARERGCMVAVASGRSWSMVPELLRKPESMDYLICANGAAVYDTIGGTLLEHTMSSEQVLRLMDALKPLHAGWYAFIGDKTYFEWRSFSYMLVGRAPSIESIRAAGGSSAGGGPVKVLGSLHTGMGRFVRRVARTTKRMAINDESREQVRSVRKYVEAADEGVLKVGCSLPTSAACDRALEVIGHIGGFEAVRMGSHELEITAAGVTKGVSACWLMDYLKIDPACVVAFGDSKNDETLREACGVFVAMDNSQEYIKGLADDVCESVYDDGVARWLERAMAEADGAEHV